MSRPILWTPSPDRANASRMADFTRWLADHRGLHFDSYPQMWDWSVGDLDTFWRAIWDYHDLRASVPPTAMLGRRAMPGAEWLPGARLNLADQVLRHAETRPDAVAVIFRSETFGRSAVTWGALARQSAALAVRLSAMGVVQGDRIVAILPNHHAALVAWLATTRLGAVWSLCAPDMGQVAILDRFQQIEPRVLITQDGYVYAGKTIDRRAVNATIRAGLPSVTTHIVVPVIGDVPADATPWAGLTDGDGPATTAQVPCDHPLWIVYSSGTTGNPKPIVHGHGGVLLEFSKQALHTDVGPATRFCWLTSSGWIMWNSQWHALMQGATLLCIDAAPHHPDMLAIWRMVAEESLTFFGAGAAFFTACQKAAIRPADLGLTLDSIGSTGSPLPPEAYDWIYRDVAPDAWLAPISGGTDLAGAFVCGNPMLPVRAGEMQCRSLGNAVRAFDPAGREVFDTVGELVCTEPLPSMPLFFWGDSDGSRLKAAYFDTFPGVWTHGDWIEITPDGGSVIYGRSDATINRKGLRMGSSEIYRAVEALPEIMDSLVVDLEFLGRDSFMPLFVVLAPGAVLDAALRTRISDAIRHSLGPRFAPDDVQAIAAVPRTLSGKKLEVPVKKLLLGGDPARVVNRDSMANPDAFDWFIGYAARQRAGPAA